MSTAVAAQPTFAERARAALTPLNFHFAGVAALVLLNLYLLAHMAVAWQTASSRDASALATQTAAMNADEQAARPLRGLDGKLQAATANADRFSVQRLPFADSEVVGELGTLAKRQNVKLSRVQYAESPVLEGSAGAVTEVRMDASLTGEYRSLVVFINSLERDHIFFLITGVALTGQQSGTVNLRLKVNTYLRAPQPGESSQRTMPAYAEAEGVPGSQAGAEVTQ